MKGDNRLPMETSFDLLIWRRALPDAAPVPAGSDLADWAAGLAAAGEDAAAGLLLDVAALYQGFSAQAITSRRSGASAGTPFDELSASGPSSTLDRAFAELRDLARSAARAGCLRLTLPPSPVPSSRPDNPAGIGAGILAPAAIGDIAAVSRDLRTALESEVVDGDTLATLLDAVFEAGHRCAALDYRAFAQAPLGLFVPAIAAVGLIDFVLSTRDLWRSPLGSPELFHQIARLDSAGLGPYFGNVVRLAPRSRHVIDLARTAREAAIEAGDAEAQLTAWLVLLSRGCKDGLLCEVVDDLGDLAEHDALMAILDRVASGRAAAIDVDMVMRLRDAGLDNADYVLAARAQRVIVRLRPYNKLEGVILGSIEASGGEFGRAEAIFREWLARTPDDADLRERLLAVRRDRFDGFVVGQGFGSPPDRRDTRLRRRGVPPDYPRRRGERLRAVDVG